MSDQSQRKDASPVVAQGLTGIKHIIAVGSGKGGVGKSTVTTNLAIALKRAGARVGLLDADIYGPSQPEMLGAAGTQPVMEGERILPLEKHGLRFMSLGLFLTDDQPVIWRGPLASRMVQQFLTDVVWGELDYLLIDLPPGSGDVQITLAQQAFLTGAIIVTTPQQLSLGVAKKGLQMFAHVNVPILGIVENMSGFTCPHCGEHTAIFKTGGGAQMASTLGVNFLGGIPIDPDLMASADDGVPLLERNTTSPAAVAFAELAGKLAGVLSQKEFADFDLPKTIDVSNNGGLVLEWADGEKSEFSPHDLRVNCPCAGCVDEQTGQRTLNPKSVPLDIRIKDFQRVGRYAVACAFSDGHNTGIYSYSRLRELAHRHQETERKTFDV